MAAMPIRGEEPTGARPEQAPEPAPARSGGVEGGTILVGLILLAGLVLMALKLAGVLG